MEEQVSSELTAKNAALLELGVALGQNHAFGNHAFGLSAWPLLGGTGRRASPADTRP